MREVELQQALEALGRGEVLAYPTETFYGLGVDIRQEAALEKLFALKGREERKSVSVLVSGVDQMEALVSEIGSKVLRIIDNFLPGPLTLVLPAKDGVAEKLCSEGGFIGIRWSSHPVAQRLVLEFQSPITTTSANLSGSPAALRPAELREYFEDQDGLVWLNGGELPPSQGSTVVKVEAESLKLLREGEIAFVDLQKIFLEG